MSRSTSPVGEGGDFFILQSSICNLQSIRGLLHSSIVNLHFGPMEIVQENQIRSLHMTVVDSTIMLRLPKTRTGDEIA